MKHSFLDPTIRPIYRGSELVSDQNMVAIGLPMHPSTSYPSFLVSSGQRRPARMFLAISTIHCTTYTAHHTHHTTYITHHTHHVHHTTYIRHHTQHADGGKPLLQSAGIDSRRNIVLFCSMVSIVPFASTSDCTNLLGVSNGPAHRYRLRPQWV